MDTKNVWMYLFFAALLICVVLAALLAQSQREAKNKEKYDELKRAYIELAERQSGILSAMMLNREALRTYNSRYKGMADDAALDTAVRKDIGWLEVKIEELGKE